MPLRAAPLSQRARTDPLPLMSAGAGSGRRLRRRTPAAASACTAPRALPRPSPSRPASTRPRRQALRTSARGRCAGGRGGGGGGGEEGAIHCSCLPSAFLPPHLRTAGRLPVLPLLRRWPHPDSRGPLAHVRRRHGRRHDAVAARAAVELGVGHQHQRRHARVPRGRHDMVRRRCHARRRDVRGHGRHVQHQLIRWLWCAEGAVGRGGPLLFTPRSFSFPWQARSASARRLWTTRHAPTASRSSSRRRAPTTTRSGRSARRRWRSCRCVRPCARVLGGRVLGVMPPSSGAEVEGVGGGSTFTSGHHLSPPAGRQAPRHHRLRPSERQRALRGRLGDWRPPRCHQPQRRDVAALDRHGCRARHDGERYHDRPLRWDAACAAVP